MNNILICAPGGSGGNFISCLIRIFHDQNYMTRFDLKLPDDGCCDYIADNSLGRYLDLTKNLDNIYPVSDSGADILYHGLTNVDLSQWGRSELSNDQIHTIHYINPNHINRFLTIDNLKVILIKVKITDTTQVAINKLTKNYFVKNPNMDRFKTHMLGQLTLRSNLKECQDSAEYVKNIDNLDNMPQQVKKDILTCWVRHIRRIGTIPLPEPHDRLLTLYFEDMMNNKDLVIDQIGKFVGCSSNDNLLQFYNEYLSKQPTVESYLNC